MEHFFKGPGPAAAVICLAAVLPGCGSERRGQAGAATPRPIVLLTIDTLRADHLGSYGYHRPTSPNLDALAAESLVFTRAVSTWPSTSPSFCSLFTSTYVHTNGLKRRTKGFVLPAEMETIAEILSGRGYQTGAVVGNAALSVASGFSQGFDLYVEAWVNDEGLSTRESVRANRITDRALEVLDSLDLDGLYFLWIHYLDPHQPYIPPEPYESQFDAMLPPEDQLTRCGCDPLTTAIGGHVEEQGACSFEGIIARYDGEIAYVDAELGRLLEALRDRGVMDRAVVAFTSDHGEQLAYRGGFFGHSRSVRQAEVHVPLMVRVPGAPTRGSQLKAPVDLTALAPSLLSLVGLPHGKLMQGEDLSPIILGDEAAALPLYAYSEAGRKRNYMRAMFTEHWKIIHVPDRSERRFMGGQKRYLYDLDADPQEEHNLASQRPEVVESLLPKLGEWRASKLGFDLTVVAEEVEQLPETEEQLRALGYLN
jgi:arylsulfatase A-like enzyme